MKKTLVACMFILNGAMLISCQQTHSDTYQIIHKFSVPGDGFWDYLTIDEKTGRVFVSHGTVTQVLDGKTGKLIGTIDDTPGVHGITLSPELDKAYISCGRDSSVVVIKLSTLVTLTRIPTKGVNPDAILYDAYSGHVFVYNGGSSNVTVIDSKTDQVKAIIALPGKPEFSVSDGKGRVYVNIEDKSLVLAIDSKKGTIENTWSLAPGEEPSGLALDNRNHRLFSVCSNKKMIVMNALNGEIISVLDIGEGSDGCAFDPELERAYSSNGEGTLTVVQEGANDSYAVLTTLETQMGARTIGLNKKTHHLYLPTAKYGDRPEPTAENPRPRPTIAKGTFTLLDIAPN
jgi:YVTN family beta-propeller protein